MTTDETWAWDWLSRELNVSRETQDMLRTYVRLLLLWQNSINLVSPKTIESVWVRHVVDSAQLIRHVPDNATRILDLGSGAGFPAVILAILAKERKVQGHFVLVESSGKKAAFLRQVAQELALTGVEIRNERIEHVVSECAETHIITARALAPLVDLLRFVDPLLKTGAIALFPKGRDAERELTEARKHWHFFSSHYPSATDPDARILKLWV